MANESGKNFFKYKEFFRIVWNSIEMFLGVAKFYLKVIKLSRDVKTLRFYVFGNVVKRRVYRKSFNFRRGRGVGLGFI